MFRYDIPAFNEDVVREALLNAVTHREYRDGGSIRVLQFPNRLEIISPGGFPTGITADNIINCQNPRNRCIAEALQHCGLVERSGQGADRIFCNCIKEGKNRPDYTYSDDSQVSLILDGHLRNPRFIQYLKRLKDERSMDLSLGDFLVLDRVRAGEEVPENLKANFTKLKNHGVLEKAGKGRGVGYTLSCAFYEYVGETDAYTRRKDLDKRQNQQLVLRHIQDCSSRGATMAEFQQVLPNKTRRQISTLLRDLKSSGHVRVQGKTRGARWHLVKPVKKGKDQ